ncbi:rhomboid family intramembrane serine protease [Marivirga atlantica]|jgi:membrane associated rhomboid family serine protease|uniref:Rhomboid family intramembrane serine protease n=1 Tax=Marivirga atlantica TaxID=1548457 RepID=A0A937DJ47_9BACT|nr:rhomboid family intramembrane serine protease [Marivirga atlantica]MBL0764509.1 rhomboid family intramembrane serine protease [Marivirga atlantica]
MFARLTPVVKNLLLVNIALLLIPSILNIDLGELFGLRYVFAESFAPYQFITYMFLHANFGHLLGNMFALFIFGPMLERFWGAQRFFLFYMVTGVGAGLLYGIVDFVEMQQLESAAQAYIANPNYEAFNSFINNHASYAFEQWYDFIDAFGENPDSQQYISSSIQRVQEVVRFQGNMPLVGASGAVFGILFAFGFLFPNTQLMLLIPPIPIKAKYLVTFYGLYELYAGIQRAPGDNVAHWAHLGGMLIAFILLKIWQDKRNNFY